MSVDYNQIAKYEAAIELLNSLRAVFETYEDDTKYGIECENRAYSLMKEKQNLNPKDDEAVAKVRETYAPLAREYYGNHDFVMSDKFLNTKVT